MKAIYKQLALTAGLSVGFGVLATVLVVNGGNGYTASFVFLPLFFLIGLAALVLIIAGIAMMSLGKNIGPCLLLAALLLPGCFFGSALVAKHFEWGAYREDPMISFPPEISNIVLLNKGVTNDQINEFWTETVSTKQHDGGSWPLPGVSGITRLSDRDGHETVEFSFFDSATEEQREYVYSRVRSSPIVFKLLENVPTKDYMPSDDPPSNDNRPKKEIKVDKIIR